MMATPQTPDSYLESALRTQDKMQDGKEPDDWPAWTLLLTDRTSKCPKLGCPELPELQQASVAAAKHLRLQR